MITKSTPLTGKLRELYMELLTTRQFNAAKLTASTAKCDITCAVAMEFNHISEHANNAFADLNNVINAMRNATGENPYTNASDEQIASVIVEKLKERRASKAINR